MEQTQVSDLDSGQDSQSKLVSSVKRGLIMLRVFLTGFMRDRKSWVLVFLGVLPVLFAFGANVIPSTSYPAALFYVDFTRSVYIALLIPLYSLLLGTAALNDEIESHTIIQFVSRPIRRFEILVWRYIAALIAGIFVAFVVTGAFFGVVSLRAAIGIELLVGAWGICAICVAVYSSIFITLGISIKRPLIWGVLVTLYEQLLGILFVFLGGGPFSLSGHIAHVGSTLLPYTFTIPDWAPGHSAILLIAIAANCLMFAAVIFHNKDLD
ncbi:MAG: ABC transporter permease subunit [Candidatus Thorarchaeota archaeon]